MPIEILGSYFIFTEVKSQYETQIFIYKTDYPIFS